MATDDERIKKDVVDQLCRNSRVDASHIKVDVSGGRVTLTGSVVSYAAKKRAENDSQEVKGVRSVENELVIQIPSSLTPSDTILRSQIEALFVQDPDMDANAISVSVTDGMVALKGTVDTYLKKNKGRRTSIGCERSGGNRQ